MLDIGIVGGGHMGRRHAQVVADSRNARLTAIADPGSSRLAEEMGVSAYGSFEALLEGSHVDALIIASPNEVHVSNALTAVDAGIPALVEKPVSVTIDDGTALAARSRQAGVPLLVGHHRRYHPATVKAREAIDSGLLGRVVTVNGMWVTRKPDSYFDQLWRRAPGAGVVLLNLVHELDLLRHLIGEVTSVMAVDSRAWRSFEVEDSVAINLEFDSGAIGSIVASDAAVSPWTWDQGTHDDDAWPFDSEARSIFLSGTSASLSLPDLRVHGRRGGGAAPSWHDQLDHYSLSVDPGNAFERQFAHFTDVVAGHAEPLVSVDDALRTMRLTLAVQDAARHRTVIRLDEEARVAR